MVGHHRERNDLNREATRQRFEALTNPVLAMLEVLAADGVLAAKGRKAHAPHNAMIEADFAVIDQIASWVRGSSSYSAMDQVPP